MKPELTPLEAVGIMQDAGSWLRNILPLADESIKKWKAHQ